MINSLSFVKIFKLWLFKLYNEDSWQKILLSTSTILISRIKFIQRYKRSIS
jgi:hypothetical protein